MKNKIKRRSLKEEFNKLSEQNLPPQPQSSQDFAPVSMKPVSLDQIVDRYIVRYERESIPLEGQGLPQPIDEAADIKSLVKFLLEQTPPPPPTDDEEEPDPNDPAAADPAGDAGAPPPAPDAAAAPAPGGDPGLGGDLGGGGDMMGGEGDEGGGGTPPTGAPPVMNTPQININNFCRSIARLLNNFDVLLNPKTIMLNRVEAYIKSNYDERTAKYFIQVMERNYGVRGTSTEYPEDDGNAFPTPFSGLPGSSGGAG